MHSSSSRGAASMRRKGGGTQVLGLALLGLAASIAVAKTAPAAIDDDAEPADKTAAAETSVPDAELTGREIYEKVLDNRFDSYIEDLTMQSGDRGGNIQATEMQIKYLNFRDDSTRILSKVIMKYLAPQDVRHLGYLVINKSDGTEDQFVYRPSARRVQRINLRGEAIFGTDFAFEDIIPQELENATYDRKPDSTAADLPVYVVEVTPIEEQDSDYSKFEVYVTLDHFVALKVVYWDRDDVKIKELNSDPGSITLYEHEEKGQPKRVWIAKQQKIVHLKLDTWTVLDIDKLDPTVKLKSRHFSERELTKGH